MRSKVKPPRVPPELTAILRQEYHTLAPLLNQVLGILKQSIGYDLGTVALVEDEGDRRLVVRQRAYAPLPAEEGERRRMARFLRIGGEELPPEKRSFMGYVAYTRKPRRSGDVRREKFYVATRKDIRSEAAAPVLWEGELLGVINLESRRLHYYTAAQERMLVAVARRLAHPLHALMSRLGVRRPLALSLLDHVVKHLDALPVGIPVDASDVLSRVAATIAEALDSRSCTIWLLEESRTNLTLRGAAGPHAPYVNDHKVARSPTLAWRAIEQRSSLRLGRNYHRDEASGQYDVLVYGKKLATPLLIVPLLTGGQAIGVIKVGLREPTPEHPLGLYSPKDQMLLESVQGQIAAALELKRLEMERREQLLERSRHLSLLSEIIEHWDLEKALAQAVAKVPDLCRGVHCSIFLWDQTRGAFVLRATNGLAPELIGEACYLPGEGLTGWVGKFGKSLILNRRDATDLVRIHPELK